MHIKNIVVLIVTLCLCVMSVLNIVGCSTEQKDNNRTYNNQYMDYGQDAAQYTTFLDKEITPVTNYLVSNLSLLRKLVAAQERDIYTEKTALRTAKSDLKNIKDILNRISNIPAGKGYNNNKKRTLNIIKDIRNTFNDYIDSLEKMKKKYIGYSNLSIYQSAFTNQYIELTDEFTNSYK